MPTVKSVILVIILTGEFSTETQYHNLKHNAVHSIQLVHFSMTMLWEALQARQLQSGKKQVIASNSISLHNRKPERRLYPPNACVLPLQVSNKRVHLHLDNPWICLQISKQYIQ